MQRLKTKTIADKEITFRELSVAQIRNLMDSMGEEEVNTIDILFPDRLPAIVITESTGLSIEKLEEDFYPSELKEIVDEVEKLNPFFVNLMTRMMRMGEKILERKTLTPSVAD